MIDNNKILNKLNTIIAHYELGLKEATMLKVELLGVVSDNSPRKGKTKREFPESEKAKILARRTKNMFK